jgi:hypothetical protein
MLKETEAVAVSIPRQNLVIGALGIVYGDRVGKHLNGSPFLRLTDEDTIGATIV